MRVPVVDSFKTQLFNTSCDNLNIYLSDQKQPLISNTKHSN